MKEELKDNDYHTKLSFKYLGILHIKKSILFFLVKDSQVKKYEMQSFTKKKDISARLPIQIF